MASNIDLEYISSLFISQFSLVFDFILPYIYNLFYTSVFILGLGLLLVLFRTFLSFKKVLSEKYILLELTPPAHNAQQSYSTDQLFSLIHGLANQRTLLDKVIGYHIHFSLEIVSSKNQGIRYLIRTPKQHVDTLKKGLISYMPQMKIEKVSDYISTQQLSTWSAYTKVLPFTLSQHFAYPLKKQTDLSKHDPIAYITGMMTKLKHNELVALQLVVAPFETKEVKTLLNLMLNKGDVLDYLKKKNLPVYLIFIFQVAILIFKLIVAICMIPFWIIGNFATGGKTDFIPLFFSQQDLRDKPFVPYEQEVVQNIQHKIEQPIFNTSIRVLTINNSKKGLIDRISGFRSAFSTYASSQGQFLRIKKSFRLVWLNSLYTWLFEKRLNVPTQSSQLSISEISSIYHFPFTEVTKTEDLVKSHSKDLPAPLSVKNTHNYDVIFGKNTYGNSTVDIGLTDEDRSRHVYIIGQTGSGKSTIIYHMAKDDIAKGRGVAIIDPHGDLAEDLVACVPESRINDCIYLNPFDVGYPVGINLLELTPSLEGDELEQEKELVCEGVVSVFRRIFSNDEKSNAHRIEYILRNAIYTAFYIPDATIFTVYELLNNPKYQKQVTRTLTDENLKNFWKNEFGKAGSFQVVKMVSGVTAKIGRFLFSPSAKRILEQPKSTINFDEILESGKILICNMVEGKLGEDTSQLLGTTIITKLQQSAMRRSRGHANSRKPYYIFVDEFQNFATSSFTKLLSGGRKFGLRMTIAQQTTAQQEDRNVVNVILANTGTVVCFRTASPVDEELMAAQFSPYVDEGDISSLPRYRFYMRLAAVTPEPPFSGHTLPILVNSDTDQVHRIIETSRTNYAKKYQPMKSQPNTNLTKSIQTKSSKTTRKPSGGNHIGTLI